jgi:4-hydroxy-3-methylbut-2-enyl diphosphate reductase
MDASTILHYNFHTKTEEKIASFLPSDKPIDILLTSGASCPDALVEGVIEKLVALFGGNCSVEDMAKHF